MASAMNVLCVVAALLAIVNVAAAANQPDSTSQPQDTADDIHLSMDRAPCVPCSYCVWYNIPLFGPLTVNVSFVSDTKMNADITFLSNTARCLDIKYRVDNGPKELVIPKQSTNCGGLLALSYVEPISKKLDLDRQARDSTRNWLTTFSQCAGNMSP